MKRLSFLIAMLMCCLVAFPQAEKAKYYIEGEYSISQDQNGQFVYQLSNITSKGISFTPAEVIYGKVEDDESISFTFDKATTTCPDGFAAGLKFWKWQFDGKSNSWQRDSEVKDAQQNFETDKVMVVELVLDCSKSLGDDNFEKLKSSATKFINILYNASSDGSIRLGIIGFNTMGNTDRMVRDIEPLTKSSRDAMIQFIQGLTMYNNTALYYAMRKGGDQISEYVNNMNSEDAGKFDYACMVSFTDGYDNHSMDAQLGVPQKGLENPYFQYVRDNVVNRQIGSATLKSFVIAIRGNDVAEDNKLYKAVFDGLSSDAPFLLDDFNQLEKQFEDMAQELIKRWQNLTCYVPSAHQGKVRWTLGNDFSGGTPEPVKQEESQTPKAKRTLSAGDKFFGVNAGVDFECTPRFYPFGLGIGFDFALPVNNAAIGGMFNLKYDILGPTHFAFGPLFLLGNYENNYGFMLGAGLDMRFATELDRFLGSNRARDAYNSDNVPSQLTNCIEDRFGAAFKLRLGITTQVKRLYFFTDLSFGRFKATYNCQTPSAVPSDNGQTYMIYTTEKLPLSYFNFSLNVGYRF